VQLVLSSHLRVRLNNCDTKNSGAVFQHLLSDLLDIHPCWLVNIEHPIVDSSNPLLTRALRLAEAEALTIASVLLSAQQLAQDGL